MFNYYGVDWLIFLLIVVHLHLIAERKRSAFLFGALATIFGVAFGIMVDSLASILMNVVFCVLHIKAWIKWR